MVDTSRDCDSTSTDKLMLEGTDKISSSVDKYSME